MDSEITEPSWLAGAIVSGLVVRQNKMAEELGGEKLLISLQSENRK
jgi:hypothetical protein